MHVLGHANTLALLERIKGQSFVFTGPDGVGRRRVAQWWSRWLNCPRGGCGQCATCTTSHLDYLEISPDIYTKDKKLARNPQIKLEQIVPRDNEDHLSLLEWAETLPNHRYKVAVLDSAHLLNENAGNALLKLLEEPPAHLILILIAPSKNHIMPTLASRSMEVAFGRVPNSLLASLSTDPETLNYADGSVGKLKWVLEHPQEFNLLQDNTKALLEGLASGPEATYVLLDSYLKQQGDMYHLARCIKQHFGTGDAYATCAAALLNALELLGNYVNEDLVMLNLAYTLSSVAHST